MHCGKTDCGLIMMHEVGIDITSFQVCTLNMTYCQHSSRYVDDEFTNVIIILIIMPGTGH